MFLYLYCYYFFCKYFIQIFTSIFLQMMCHDAKMSENGIFWQKKGEMEGFRLQKPAKTADFYKKKYSSSGQTMNI